MISSIYVNLPVKDLPRSKAFFTALGFTFNGQFTNDIAACLVLGENIFAMLLTEEKFQSFTRKKISDATTQTEVLLAMQVKSRAEVDATLEKALASGGSAYRDPQDHGWMYERSFADPDGHQWEVFFIDEKAIPKQ